MTDSKQLLAAAACLNMITLAAISAGLILVNKWIREYFIGERRWRCTKDGNYLVYFILILILTLFQIVVTIEIS